MLLICRWESFLIILCDVPRHYIDEPVMLIIHLTVSIYSLGGGGGYGNDRGGYGNDRGT